MSFDATLWVAVSFILFFLGLVYLKVPQKINELLNKLILEIKIEIEESEKLRSEAKKLLDNAQNKLDGAKAETTKILDQTKKDSEKFLLYLIFCNLDKFALSHYKYKLGQIFLFLFFL